LVETRDAHDRVAAKLVQILVAATSADWWEVVVWVVVGAYWVYRYWRQRRKPDRDISLDTYGGRANDERDAFIQLRAWAVVGQAAFAAVVVLTAASIAGYDRFPQAFAAFLVLTVIHFGSVFAMRFRE